MTSSRPYWLRLGAVSLSRTRIGWLLTGVVLAVALPLNLVVLTTIWRLANEAVDAQRNALLYTAQSIAGAVDSELSKYATIAQSLARSPALLDLDLAAFEREAQRVFKGLPGAWVLVSTVDGKPLLNLAAKAGEPLPERRSAAGLMAQRIALESGQPYYSDLSRGRRIDDWITWIEVPVTKDGKPQLALSVFVGARLFADLLNAQRRPTSWLTGIMDRRGRYIARAPDERNLIGQQASAGWRNSSGAEGIAEFNSIEGEPLVNANAHSKLSGWTVGVAVKKSEFNATAWSATRGALLLGGSLSILSLLLAAFIARRIAIAMDELGRDAPALIDGVPLASPDAPPEISALRDILAQAGRKRRTAEEARRVLNEHQDLLLRVTTNMIEARDVRELGEIVSSAVADILDIDVCLNYRRIPQQDCLELVFQSGMPAQAASAARVIEIGETLCGEVAATSQPIIADRARVEADPKASLIRSIGVGAYCCHPLRARDGRVLGTLSFGSTRRSTFDAAEFTFLQTLVNFLSEAWERLEAEQVTRISNERQRLILDSVQAFVGVLDTDGTLLEANQPALVAGGLVREDVIGCKLWDCAWWSHDENEAKKLKEAVSHAASGHITRFDTVLRMLGETHVAMDFVLTPVTDKDGSVRLLIPSGFDISDRKQAEERLRTSHDSFRQLIECAPFGIYTVDADFKLAHVGAGAQKVFENVQPKIGRDFAEVLRQIWQEPFASEAIAHFRHTLATGETYHSSSTIEGRRDIDELQAYDWKIERIQLPDSRLGVVCHFYDLSDRLRYEAALSASEAQLRAIINTAQGGFWLIDPSGRTSLANPRMAEMLGTTQEHLRDASIDDFCFPEDLEEASDRLIQALSGEAVEFEFRFRRSDGSPIPVLGAMTSLRAPDGTMVGALGGFLDLTERKLNEERQRVLMRELVHRGKNLIAVVQSIARQTFRPDRPLEEARAAFDGRLRALANTHGSLTSERSDTAMLHDIVDAELKTFGNRITVEGPQVELPSRTAQTFSLVLHELATNASKYGALSAPAGQVSITWRIVEGSEPRFSLEWRESGGPALSGSVRKGFGTALITTIAASDFGCTPKLDLDLAGLRYSIDAPLVNIAAADRG